MTFRNAGGAAPCTVQTRRQKPSKILRRKNGGSMRSKTLASLGILLGLAISPAFAQIDSAPGSPLTTSIGPIQIEGANDADADGPTPSATSINWAGYAVTGSGFTG